MTFEDPIDSATIDGLVAGLISLIYLIELPFAIRAFKKQRFIDLAFYFLFYSSYFHLYLYYVNRPPHSLLLRWRISYSYLLCFLFIPFIILYNFV